MSSIITFPHPGNVAVLVHGTLDRAVVAALVRDVRRVFRQIIGRWSVSLRPCATGRGRWRLELRGRSGRHVWSFAATTARLPEMVLEKVREFVRDSRATVRSLKLTRPPMSA